MFDHPVMIAPECPSGDDSERLVRHRKQSRDGMRRCRDLTKRGLRRMNYEIQEVKRRGVSRLRDKSLSAEEKDEIRRDVKAQLDELLAQRRRYVEESRVQAALQ